MKTRKILNSSNAEKESRFTVREMHDTKIAEFEKYYALLPRKEQALEKIIKKISKLEKDPLKRFELSEAKDLEKSLREEISKMKSKEELSEYIINSHQILMKMNDSSCESKKDLHGGLSGFVTITGEDNRANMVEEYLQSTQKSCIGTRGGSSNDSRRNIDQFICDFCDKPMVVNEKESALICEHCGACSDYWDVDKPQWSDEVDMVTPFSYRRHNHFEDHLRRVQGKENKNIPLKVIREILIELRKLKVRSVEDISEKRIKAILKKLGFNKYYNNINSIMYMITGKKPPKFSKELEDQLRMMFNIIQHPFELYKKENPHRKNFLSYKYTFNKFLRIIGERNPAVLQFLPHFSLLKSREKLIEQDSIWKYICDYYGWTFMSSA